MYRNLALAAALAASFAAAPAFAAASYYVGKDVKTAKCSVSTKKPDGTKVTMVGTASYKTKAEATTAMKADTTDCPA